MERPEQVALKIDKIVQWRFLKKKRVLLMAPRRIRQRFPGGMG